jgi:hypothetical protein
VLALPSGGFAQDPPSPDPRPRPEAKPADAYRDQIVADVEHEPITYHELELRAQLTAEYRDLKDNQPDNKRAIQQSLHRLLETLIEERLLLQQCSKDKLTLTKDDEKRLDREIERLAEPHGGIEGLKRVLARIRVPYDYFVECRKTNLLITKLLFKNVPHDTYVGPQLIRRYYEENKREKFKRDAVTKFFEIDVYTDVDFNSTRVPAEVKKLEKQWSAETARKYAGDVRAKLVRDPNAWRQIATESTMNVASAVEGGLVQVAGDKPLVDQMGLLGEAADKLQPGEVSPVLETKLGFHIICMKQRSPADVLPFSEVQREISNRLCDEIWQERLKAWIGKVKAEAFYRIYLPAE